MAVKAKNVAVRRGPTRRAAKAGAAARTALTAENMAAFMAAGGVPQLAPRVGTRWRDAVSGDVVRVRAVVLLVNPVEWMVVVARSGWDTERAYRFSDWVREVPATGGGVLARFSPASRTPKGAK